MEKSEENTSKEHSVDNKSHARPSVKFIRCIFCNVKFSHEVCAYGWVSILMIKHIMDLHLKIPDPNPPGDLKDVCIESIDPMNPPMPIFGNCKYCSFKLQDTSDQSYDQLTEHLVENHPNQMKDKFVRFNKVSDETQKFKILVRREPSEIHAEAIKLDEEFKQDCMSNNVLPMYYIREELENMLEDRRYDLNFQIRY